MSFDLSALSTKWFKLDVAIAIFPKLVAAMGITIYVTLAAFALALVIGFPILLLRRSRYKIIAHPASLMFELIRSTPLLVQIYFYFFVLPEIGIELSPVTTGIVAMTVHYGCYLSEVYRSGLEAIPHGQWDAAAALDFSRLDVYRRVILPQIIPPLIPAAGNFLIAMFKDTPLLASIAATEIMFVATQHGAEYFQYLEPVTMCGLIFLLLSLGSSLVIRAIEARVGRVWLGRDRQSV